MNLLILEENERISDSTFVLTNRKAEHILEILKSEKGDVLKSGLYNQSIGKFYIQKIDKIKKCVTGYYKAESNVNSSSYSQINLIASLQRPQTLKKIIQLSACTAISSIFFLCLINQKNLI
ncbi:MAG: hypothetical protein H7A23_21590 [Leptospiraceae bacterium]|nr:hypothetical protein [Leptospiraceae bacterium]MCP5497157.1 hypothetical protein [Leptospiraceae bacterium]